MPDYMKDGDRIKEVVTAPSWAVKDFEAELLSNKHRLAQAKERLAGIPVKTKPDAETLQFWQAANQMERQSAQDEVDRLQALVDKQEAVLKAGVVEK